MKKKFNLFMIIAFVAITWFGIMNVQEVKAATIGQQLTSPEVGWARYDDKGNLTLGGKTDTYNYGTVAYAGSVTRLNDKDCYAGFNFTGTKLRIIGTRNDPYCKTVKILIDNVPYTLSSSGSTVWQCLLFEVTSLDNKEHSVKIIREVPYSTSDNDQIHLDAIDIDANGALKPYTESQATSVTLNKTTVDLNVGQIEILSATVLPENATNKKVVWTSSDPTIATVDESGKVTSIKEGQVTITAKVENTNLTATCEVNVTKPVEVNKNRAILSISLVNRANKEYDVSMQEVDKFINWFEERSNGDGLALYSFSKKISPYKSVREYIIHSKIASFEVREYEVTE